MVSQVINMTQNIILHAALKVVLKFRRSSPSFIPSTPEEKQEHDRDHDNRRCDHHPRSWQTTLH